MSFVYSLNKQDKVEDEQISMQCEEAQASMSERYLAMRANARRSADEVMREICEAFVGN